MKIKYSIKPYSRGTFRGVADLGGVYTLRGCPMPCVEEAETDIRAAVERWREANTAVKEWEETIE